MSGPDEAVDAFLAASRALVGVSARSLAEVSQVTLPQFRALVVIAGNWQATMNGLAERLDIHPSTATRLCDRLVDKGLIRRTERRTDRRETELALTARGRRLVDRVTERRRRDLAAIVERMSPAQRRDALRGLSAFAAAAGETPGAAWFGWADADRPPSGTPRRGGGTP
jgi:DNA-binding MarR family transcriptional regulator